MFVRSLSSFDSSAVSTTEALIHLRVFYIKRLSRIARLFDKIAADHETLDERVAPAHWEHEVHQGEVHSAPTQERGLSRLGLIVLT